MAITDPLVLPRDVILLPVADLPEETRARFAHDEGDFAITHPRSRTPSRILDASSAALVGQFREPRTIVEAVIRFCREQESDPETTLEEAYPLLQRLLDSGFLVEESAAEAEGIKPSLHPGEEIEGFTIVECVQGLEDTELYLVRAAGGGAGALKIERPSVAGRSGGLFEREEAILRRLDGAGSPRLLAAGALDDGRRWLVTAWFSGVDASTAAWDLQRQGSEGRAELLTLVRRIAEAYAALHARGVIHADVHPRNVLVGADGQVRLLDFGYSRWDAAPPDLADPARAGVAFFYEPEYAAAARAGAEPPDATAVGEQYAVAALLYQLLTGAHLRDYSLDKDEMLRQIAEEPPLPFAERGADPWPEVEAVLRRALAKDPAERYPSMADFAAALAEIAPPRTASRSRPNDLAEAETLLERVLERVRPGGALFENGVQTRPTASVNYGAAGIACALYRIAQGRADGELLALADLWAERAAALLGTDGACYNPEIQIEQEQIGPAALYHTEPGIHATRALIAQAQSFEGLRDEAIAKFLKSCEETGPNQDVTLGRSGLLLGGALLLDTLDEGDTRRTLTAWGEGLRQRLWEELDAQPPIRDEDRSSNLGLAHGWAGHLYAALRWSRVANTGLPTRFTERLDDLAACARPWGRGVRWRWHDVEGAWSMPGWCNGSAGYLYLWALAAEALQEPRWQELAERTAWNTWESSDTVLSLCCGLAGRSYALLSFWRKGGGEEWLRRARVLANRAARGALHPDAETPDSLYKGAMGVAALAGDLGQPGQAAMPLFEEEGWGPKGSLSPGSKRT
jgi:serine/threonine-protein kinase